MTRFRLTLAYIALAAVTRPALAAPELYSIDARQVAVALDKIGIQIAPSQIVVLMDVVVNTPKPELHVRSVEQSDAGQFIVRLECENLVNCLPFMASVLVDKEMAAKLSSATSRLSLVKGLFSSSVTRLTRAPIVIRSGSRATLLLDGTHIHIRIPVVCLQSGTAGQTIRATTTDHKQVYAAQVVEIGLLRGRL